MSDAYQRTVRKQRTKALDRRDEVVETFRQFGIEQLSKEECLRIFQDLFRDWPAHHVQALIDAIPARQDGLIEFTKLVDYIYLAPHGVRKEFQGALIGEKAQEACEHIILISDIGQDNDDEMALLLLSELERRREVKVEAVIANLLPANRRAALARGTLDLLDMYNVPVGIGSDGGSDKHTDTFSHHISDGMTGIDYFSEPWEQVQQLEKVMGTDEELAMSEKFHIYDGQKLLVNKLSSAAEKSINLVLISSLKDAAMLLRSHEQLFLAKIKTVTIMGGMQLAESPATAPSAEPNSQRDERPGDSCGRASITRGGPYINMPLLVPSDGHNNLFDGEASKFFYRRCQEIGVPLIVLSRFTAYGCPVQKFVYDLMVRCPIPNPTVCRLQRAQRSSIESLWQKVCAGGMLPPRCSKQWFCNTFCEGMGAERGSSDSMWDLVKTFNMYDPLAVLASLPSKRTLFFQPKEYVGPHGVIHLNIGETETDTGIPPNRVDDLHDFLMSNWIRVAGRIEWTSRADGVLCGAVVRPPQLDHEQLTAALIPMKSHGPEELEKLNENVLALLGNEWPQLKNSSLLTTWRDRDELMKAIGPEMLLVDPETIQTLGRIPHSAEGKTITMEQAAKRAADCDMRFFIEMFSHRWHSPYAPDDRYCNKARVLCEWAEYRRGMNFRVFFWIDHACINQSDIAPGVAMLPLYVSCCNNILCYDTPDYEHRAWCRVERLMFSAFVAPNNEYVSPEFEHRSFADKTPSGELKPHYERKNFVPDPSGSDAVLSFPSDSDLISSLKELCTEHWAQCWKDGLMDIVEQKVGLSEVRSLRYGGTEVRVRVFN